MLCLMLLHPGCQGWLVQLAIDKDPRPFSTLLLSSFSFAVASVNPSYLPRLIFTFKSESNCVDYQTYLRSMWSIPGLSHKTWGQHQHLWGVKDKIRDLKQRCHTQLNKQPSTFAVSCDLTCSWQVTESREAVSETIFKVMWKWNRYLLLILLFWVPAKSNGIKNPWCIYWYTWQLEPVVWTWTNHHICVTRLLWPIKKEETSNFRHLENKIHRGKSGFPDGYLFLTEFKFKIL